MDIAQLEALNGVYAPLVRRAKALCRSLKETGLSTRWGWYEDHSVFLDGEYRAEAFPIPVLEVEGGCHRGGCDVGLHVDEVFVEVQLPRRAALAFDWSQLPAPFEVYGVDDYLHDFYRAGMDVGGIAGRIGASGEDRVGVSLTFPWDTPDHVLLSAVSHGLRAAQSER